ncbi:hypothetical protein DLD82_09695 [Methanospirillum stamsii]|uniref:Uncharacterized protein n=1 Tax=Methanospirillum stamsii TaxID=1277351 RepID=A0A2V2NAZ4_9EURY|nr:hypothetical protein DLD82_09695 [Methanospirillum stamsii]
MRSGPRDLVLISGYFQLFSEYGWSGKTRAWNFGYLLFSKYGIFYQYFSVFIANLVLTIRLHAIFLLII